jgi:hypothetical protein
MRELKFRGKRKDNGEWVYGGYCEFYVEYDTDESGETVESSSRLGHFIFMRNAIHEEVHPESVGQLAQSMRYQGVDREIYKDDIFINKKDASLYVVIWNPLSVRFQIKTHKIGEGSGQCWPFKWTGYDYFDLIGNTTDHPDLLKS